MSATRTPIPPSPPPSGSGQVHVADGRPSLSGWSGSGPMRADGVENVGRYELLLELAAGGMGSVYVGRQRGAGGFERLVAIKRTHPHLAQQSDFTLAFHEEARIASLIHHPNVVNVVDVYEEGGEHLLVMELIDGTSAGSLIVEARKRGEKIPRPVALRMAIDVLSGLHAAHELVGMDGTPLEVVHRDVSPQNILVGADGAVRITDFGIARALHRVVQTATGELKGKLRYMAPEQARLQPVDRRADVFSLGIVLWEMLAGERMYKGESDLDLLRAASEAEIMPLSFVDPMIPSQLETIVMQALAKSPDQRHQTAAAFASALERWAWEARELASAADVAKVVRDLTGERIDTRRKRLQDVLAGRRPAAIRSGTHPIVRGTPITSHAAILGTDPPPPRPRSGLLIAVILALAAIAGGAGFGVLAYMRSQNTAAAAAPRDLSAPTVTAPSVTPQVNVQIFAETPVTLVRGEGVSGVAFTADGARFLLPQGAKPVEIEIQFAGGATEKRSVTPTEDMAVRVAAVGSAAVSAKPGASSVPKSTGARPPLSEDGETPTGDGLRRNPYADP